MEFCFAFSPEGAGRATCSHTFVMAGPALGLVSSRITSSRSHRSRIGDERTEVNDDANALDHGDEGVATLSTPSTEAFAKQDTR